MRTSISERRVDFLFFQAEDGIRNLVRSSGLGHVYKRPITLNAANVAAGAVLTVNASALVAGRVTL